MPTHQASMPSGHQWMSRGNVVRVALRFHAWSSGCRNGAGGWHCSSPSRGPFGGLFLASTCFGLRARVAHTRSVERWFKLQLVDAQETEQNDGRGEAAVLAHSTARLSMDRLERSLLLTRACVTNDGRVVENGGHRTAFVASCPSLPCLLWLCMLCHPWQLITCLVKTHINTMSKQIVTQEVVCMS